MGLMNESSIPFHILPQRSFAAVAVSRTIQHREHVRKTLLREQEKKRKARETFHLINVPVIQQAAYEPSHHVTSDDEGKSQLFTPSLSTILVPL